MTAQIFIVVGPSGAGKDTLIRGARATRPDIHVVRRAITRPQDSGAEDHEALRPEAFRARHEAGEFAITWHAHGLDYGIPRAEIGRDGIVLMNGSRTALPAMLMAFPDATVILVTASDETLARRLAGRGRETKADIAARLARARYTIPPGIDAQVVENDGTEAEGVAAFLDALDAHPAPRRHRSVTPGV